MGFDQSHLWVGQWKDVVTHVGAICQALPACSHVSVQCGVWCKRNPHPQVLNADFFLSRGHFFPLFSPKELTFLYYYYIRFILNEMWM